MDSKSRTVSRREFLSAVGGGVALAAAGQASAAPQWPLIRAAGTHRELGRQHGEQAAGKIKSFVALLASSNHSHAELCRRALAFQPVFAKYCPHLLDEIQGLAEGAGVSLAEALAVNIRGPLHQAPDAGCTSFVIGRNGSPQHQILAGKNADMDPTVPPLGYVLHLKPLNKPQVLMWTFGGMIGYHGMNSAGVCEFDNALLGAGPPGRFGLPTYPAKRLMLECDDVRQILHLYQTIPLAANTNYAVCDGHGNILDLESTTAGTEVLHDNGVGFLVHANHYLSPRYATRKNFPPAWKDSFARQDRMTALIAAKFGGLEVADLKKDLCDHQGYPTSICRHAGSSLTVASMIAEPAAQALHVAVGNPCQHQFVTYRMDG